MCIVIDTNCFSCVFNVSSKEHVKFRPVLLWVVDGKGKVVYGGTKYKKELENAAKYARLFVELDKAGKTVEVNKENVDAIEAKVDKKISNPNFNDPHIIAITIESKCRLICTNEKRFGYFIRTPSLYPKHVSRPKIYRGLKNNERLLRDQNIVDICKPWIKGSRELKKMFSY
jgi:hypothetical protein